MLGAAGCSLTVREGEISVLMGLSGSGKSTLLRAVNGLNKVTRGDVLVNDQGQMVNVATCDETTCATCGRRPWPWCSSNSPCCPGAQWRKMLVSVSNWRVCQKSSARPKWPNS